MNSQVLTNVRERIGWKKATPVQRLAYNVIRGEKDLMACAQTGSGKTGAYLMPIISQILHGSTKVPPALEGHSEPVVLVIVPTRELAKQIYRCARRLAFGTCLEPGVKVLYGGTTVSWAESFVKGADILVATPGRLVHFVDEGFVELRRVKYLVLDEADMMLSMGFEEDIRGLVNRPDMPTQSQRQTLMFSATFPAEIQRLASDFLLHHVFLSIGIVGNANTAISQTFVRVDSQPQKRLKLMGILREVLEPGAGDGKLAKETEPRRVLVFVERRRSADYLGLFLCQNDLPAATIHGDREQSQREEAVNQLTTGFVSILVATSVAARGLDFPRIHLVVNYDLPQTIEEYVHRYHLCPSSLPSRRWGRGVQDRADGARGALGGGAVLLLPRLRPDHGPRAPQGLPFLLSSVRME